MTISVSATRGGMLFVNHLLCTSFKKNSSFSISLLVYLCLF